MAGVYTAYNKALNRSGPRGRISKTERGGSKRSRQPACKPYTPLEFPPAESLYFGTDDKWDPLRLVERIKTIKFGDEFNITDVHLDAIVAAGSAFCYSLQDFRSGDSETGSGARLSDAAVVRLATACPNLIHASLSGSTGLTDASLLAFFINCPKLHYLSITGNDRVCGKLKGPALDELREKPDLGKDLGKMRLTDQNLFDKKLNGAIKSLSAARKKLAIEVGGTHERDGHITTWLGGKEKMGYQAFGGPGGFSQCGGW